MNTSPIVEISDYPVSVSVNGREFRTMNSVVAEVFNLFARKDNWKLPIYENIDMAAVLSVLPMAELREAFPGFPEGSEAVRSFIASCVSFHVGGETIVETQASGGLRFVVRSAGYYNNIGA